MKQIFKTLTLAIVAIMTISGLSSCSKNNGGNGYRFEYTNVSFDTEKNPNAEAKLTLLKEELRLMLVAYSDEAQLVGMAQASISTYNHKGINATVTLKKGTAVVKEWKLEAKDLWHIEPADPE